MIFKTMNHSEANAIFRIYCCEWVIIFFFLTVPLFSADPGSGRSQQGSFGHWVNQAFFSFHPLNPQRFVGKLRHQTVWWVESLFFVISNNMTNHCCFAEEKQLKTWRAFSLLLWPVIHHMAITKTFSVSHFSVFVFFLVHILSIFRLNNWACICLFAEKQQFFSYETWWHTWEVTGQEGFSHLQYA